MTTVRIPLFPLDLVLFPGSFLPLHIFEPRYKAMVRRAIEQRTPFGIVLTRERGIARVGCTAQITRLLKTHADGRMDIETLGRDAFRIAELHQENPLLEATVELLEEDADIGTEKVSESLAAEVLSLYAACHGLLHNRPAIPVDNVPGTTLSYQIAAHLPIDHEVQQELLEIRFETARRARLIEHLNEFLDELAAAQRKRDKAGSNGQGKSWVN